MKIPVSVREEWLTQHELNLQLSAAVDPQLRNLIDRTWHYESRLKSLESFAQKLETGRFPDGAVLDFFACTIVVPNRSLIAEAERRLKSQLKIKDRKPPKLGRTHKASSDFPFDDLRLYACVKRALSGEPRSYDEVVFEVQVKTFLQHAWSIATHDLVYKGDSVSWSLERIAFQIKAMLEHAESSIDGADALSRAGAVNLTDPRTITVKTVLDVVQQHWTSEELPTDRVRLARTIVDALDNLEVGANELHEILVAEKAAGRGASLTHLSPYNAIIVAVAKQRFAKLEAFLGRTDLKFRLFVPREIRDLIPVLAIAGPRLTHEKRSVRA